MAHVVHGIVSMETQVKQLGRLRGSLAVLLEVLPGSVIGARLFFPINASFRLIKGLKAMAVIM
jgi:hypothetical protein